MRRVLDRPHSQSLGDSFRHAFNGIDHALRTQRNARIHASVALCVLAAGIWLGVSPVEWAALVLCMGMVFGFEMLNTAIEALADAVVPDYHPLVGVAKDVAAGAVALSAGASVLVGLVIFLPRIFGASG